MMNSLQIRKSRIREFILLFPVLMFTCILQAQTITNVAVSPTSFCPGSKVSISFTVTNGIGSSNYFTSSTQYEIYITNASGNNFGGLYASSSPTVPPSVDKGSVTITFSNLTAPSAAALPPSTLYKVSIGANVPFIAANSGTNIAPFTIAYPTVNYSEVPASTCHGGNDGSITVTASGGNSPYTYSWTGVNGFTANTASISNLVLGDYNVVVTDNSLCSTSITDINIGMADPLGVGILQITTPTCRGKKDGSISVYRIGGVDDGINPIQFKLDGHKTRPYQTSGIFSGLSKGKYTVTVKDSKGCTGILAVKIDKGPVCKKGDNDNNNSESQIGTMNVNTKSLFNSSLRVQVYPNPSASSSDFTLNVEGNSTDKVSIIVTDVLGRRHLQVHGNANQQYKLGSSLKPGIYVVQVMQGANIQTIKIVKE
ncbi:MAG TPA: T9SS type A sorting domain-containing protein [Hanamia sp.]|nr:T9SS type A sorting domain-containing protein [Hanamia sp.]